MNKIEGIKVISFDADGTLWDFEKVMRGSLKHAFNELRKTAPDVGERLTLEEMIRIRMAVAERLRGKMNLEEIRLEAFRQTLEHLGRPDDALASNLNEVYLKHRFEDIELFEDVLPVLDELKMSYDLGMLSNGNSYPELCGLEGIFKFAVFAQDYGFEKPDPRLFYAAVEKAGCSVRELLHVGDSLQDDVEGAAAAGIRCVWLNRIGVENSFDVRVDYEISSLFDLLEMLG